MNQLRRQIRRLETELADDNAVINQQLFLLSHHTTLAKIFIPALIGSFILGFVISYKKTLRQLLRSMTYYSIQLRKSYQSIKPFISQIFIGF